MLVMDDAFILDSLATLLLAALAAVKRWARLRKQLEANSVGRDGSRLLDSSLKLRSAFSIFWTDVINNDFRRGS